MTGPERAPLSVLIPTKDEERNLGACMATVAWADEIVVFDSYSTDRTLEIARERGAEVVQRPFDTFSAHKNWALDNIAFRHDWLLLVDADERVTEALAGEIRGAIAREGGPAGYYIPRRTMFCGRWIRHGGVWPDYNLRLFLHRRGRYEDRIVHEHVILDGPAGYLENPLVHDDEKGIDRYIERHNHYTTLEAIEILRTRTGAAGNRLSPSLRIRGPQRRRALKDFAQRRLPARPLFLFLYMYVLKGGFLDGRIGLRFFLLKAIFDYLTDLKIRELEDHASPLRRKFRQYLDRPPLG